MTAGAIRCPSCGVDLQGQDVVFRTEATGREIAVPDHAQLEVSVREDCPLPPRTGFRVEQERVPVGLPHCRRCAFYGRWKDEEE